MSGNNRLGLMVVVGICLVANPTGVAFAGPISFADTVMSMNPVSYWRLGELAGTTAVDETGLSDGTYSGPDLGAPGSVFNDPDTSASFNGLFDHVAIPHNAAYLLDEGTIMFCFQDQNAVHDTGLFSKDALNHGDGGHLSIFTTVDGRVQARFQDTANDHLATSDPFIQLDTWYHVALTFGTGGMHLFINGQEVDSNAYAGGMGTTSGGTGNIEPIALGASSANSVSPTGAPLMDYFSGLIDEVVIFDQALDPTVIDELYRTKLVPEPATVALLLAGGSVLMRRRRR